MTNKFYRLRSEHKKGVYKIQPIANYDTFDFLSQNTNLKVDNRFVIKEGKKCFDILPFDDSSNFAISEKFKAILKTNNISGWDCFPIEIEGLKESYYGFQNISKAGKILNLEALNNYETEFREFDITTWNGTDIFYLEETSINVITLKVKEIIEREHLSNIEILPL